MSINSENRRKFIGFSMSITKTDPVQRYQTTAIQVDRIKPENLAVFVGNYAEEGCGITIQSTYEAFTVYSCICGREYQQYFEISQHAATCPQANEAPTQ